MYKILSIALLVLCPVNVFSQTEPVVTYDGGDLYFVPSQLTSKAIPFMYSCRTDNDSGKTWFTVFDDEANVVTQSEIEAPVLKYTIRTITYQRRFFVKSEMSGTRTPSAENAYFLDDWTVVSDVTEEKTEGNHWIEAPEVYADDNSYHSRYLYLSQTLFDADDDFEFLRAHYEVMPLSYCASDEERNDVITEELPGLGGEEYHAYVQEFDDDLGGYVFTLIRYKVYGGLQHTGTDVVSLDGQIKKTLDGITSLGSVVAINGNFYVSAYDKSSLKYGLYKIAQASTALSRVAELSAQTNNQATYNLEGLRVKANVKGIVIRGKHKIFNK